jgi:hypothetical protein
MGYIQFAVENPIALKRASRREGEPERSRT